MAIYITGDTHADFGRFATKRFPEQKGLTRDDIVIVLGDFGGVWFSKKMDMSEENARLDWLNDKPFTLCYIDGNHENFSRYYTDEFPIVDFHGGKAHKIRDNIYHLMRGYVFDFEGKKFFAMGGASSHDIKDGILKPSDYKSLKDLAKDYNKRKRNGELLRIDGISWWKEELPSEEEMQRGICELEKVGYKVDYVLTHCPINEVCRWFGFYDTDKLGDYFDKLIENGLKYSEWWSGHLHKNEYGIYGNHNVIYEEVKRIE